MKRPDKMIIDWCNERAKRRERERERQHELDLVAINATARVGVALVTALFDFPRLPTVTPKTTDEMKCGKEFLDCRNEPHVCDSPKEHEGPHLCAGGTNGRTA